MKGEQLNLFSLDPSPNDGLRFGTRAELCTFYMDNDLPREDNGVKRLTNPFSRK